MHIPILFENEHLIIIDKPAGLVVHGDGKTNEPNLVDWILEYYPAINGVGENMIVSGKENQEIEINRPGIVHRIDRDTSGVLIIAKTQTSFEHLKKQFQEHAVKKTYLALVYGHVKNDEGIIDQPIGRHSRDFRMKMAGHGARGHLRSAETSYRVLGRYFDSKKKDKQGKFEQYTLLECSPATGRTHQIRVHLKWLNHPIVADSLYSGKRTATLGLGRTALHARKIEFTDSDGTSIVAESPLPPDIHSALDSLSIGESSL